MYILVMSGILAMNVILVMIYKQFIFWQAFLYVLISRVASTAFYFQPKKKLILKFSST